MKPIEETRLYDLVRQCRHQLHVDGLISNEEYAWLAAASTDAHPGKGSISVQRLEDYDRVKAGAEAAIRELRDVEAILLAVLPKEKQGLLGDTLAREVVTLAEHRKGAMDAQDERERNAGERCGVPWLDHRCDWPDAVAEKVIWLHQRWAEAQAAHAKELANSRAATQAHYDNSQRVEADLSKAVEALSDIENMAASVRAVVDSWKK